MTYRDEDEAYSAWKHAQLFAVPDAEWKRAVAIDRAKLEKRLAELRAKDERRTLDRHKREAALLRGRV